MTAHAVANIGKIRCDPARQHVACTICTRTADRHWCRIRRHGIVANRGSWMPYWIQSRCLLNDCRDSVASSDHRDELALGVGIAVDVSLSSLDRAMTSQQLHVAQ